MGGFDDGNALLKDCTSRNPFAQGLCYGLITGYFEGMRMSYTCSKDDPNINREQVKDVVIKFLKNTPEPAIYRGCCWLPALSSWRLIASPIPNSWTIN